MAAGMVALKKAACKAGVSPAASAAFTAYEGAQAGLTAYQVYVTLDAVTFKSEIADAAQLVTEVTTDLLQEIAFAEIMKMLKCFVAGTQVVVAMDTNEQGVLPTAIVPAGNSGDGTLPTAIVPAGNSGDGTLPTAIVPAENSGDGVLPTDIVPAGNSGDGVLPTAIIPAGNSGDGVLPTTIVSAENSGDGTISTAPGTQNDVPTEVSHPPQGVEEVTRMYLGVDGVMVPTVTDNEKAKRRAGVEKRRTERVIKTPHKAALPPLAPRREGTDGTYKEFKLIEFHSESLEQQHEMRVHRMHPHFGLHWPLLTKICLIGIGWKARARRASHELNWLAKCLRSWPRIETLLMRRFVKAGR